MPFQRERVCPLLRTGMTQTAGGCCSISDRARKRDYEYGVSYPANTYAPAGAGVNLPVENLFSMGKEGDSPPAYPSISVVRFRGQKSIILALFLCILLRFR